MTQCQWGVQAPFWDMSIWVNDRECKVETWKPIKAWWGSMCCRSVHLILRLVSRDLLYWFLASCLCTVQIFAMVGILFCFFISHALPYEMSLRPITLSHLITTILLFAKISISFHNFELVHLCLCTSKIEM